MADTLNKIDEQAAKMTPVSSTVRSFIGSVIFGGIVALIMGAVMKKNPQVFDNNAGGVI